MEMPDHHNAMVNHGIEAAISYFIQQLHDKLKTLGPYKIKLRPQIFPDPHLMKCWRIGWYGWMEIIDENGKEKDVGASTDLSFKNKETDTQFWIAAFFATEYFNDRLDREDFEYKDESKLD